MHMQPYITFIFFCTFCTTTQASELQIKTQNLLNTSSVSQIKENSILTSPLKKLGEGQMNILFFKVYKAEFYNSSMPYDENIYPKALKLTYQRDIEKQEFIDATQGEWEKLNKQLNKRAVLLSQEQKWLAQLNDIFPNIKKGDVILFTLNKAQQAHFYLSKASDVKIDLKNYEHLGSINDALFGEYFLSIWLSKYTSRPKLRKQLLNL